MKPMLKTKMQRPTSVIMIIMAAASGSSTQPRRRAWSPKVNQVKLWTARKPGVCSVDKKATSDKTNAMTCPAIASPAAPARRELARVRMISENASGIAGISQRLETIQEFIFGAEAERRPSNAEHRTLNDRE